MAFAVAAWFVSKMIRGLDGVAVLGGAVGVVWRGAWGWYGRADVAAVAVAAVGDCGVVVRLVAVVVVAVVGWIRMLVVLLLLLRVILLLLPLLLGIVRLLVGLSLVDGSHMLLLLLGCCPPCGGWLRLWHHVQRHGGYLDGNDMEFCFFKAIGFGDTGGVVSDSFAASK